MNILKKLFVRRARSRSDTQTPFERPYLKPIQILELGGDRNGNSYFGAFTGQDGQRYVITFPKPIGPEPLPPKLVVLGTEERIQLTGEGLSSISLALRRLAAQGGQPLDSYAAEYLEAIDLIASSLSGRSKAIL